MNNPFLLVIICSLLVIVSYLFSRLSKVSKIPAVLLLLFLGIGVQYTCNHFNVVLPSFDDALRILGVVGLMVIVLEGGMDVSLNKDKLHNVGVAAISASVILVGTALLIGWLLFMFNVELSFWDAVFYAIPFSVVSSAIVIPSVHSLTKDRKDFMILESTLSDIFGIMLFEFWIMDAASATHKAESIASNISISIVLSVVLSFILVIIFNRIQTKIRFFLFLSILALLFSIGEYFHYSALLIILIFAVILNNYELFFRGKLAKFINHDFTEVLRTDFTFITLETSFILRTFFFFIFGLSLDLDGVFQFETIFISLVIIVAILAVRLLSLGAYMRSNFQSILFLAPRGLVSILLFNRILEQGIELPFSDGIIALVIIGSNLLMMVGLLSFKGKNAT